MLPSPVRGARCVAGRSSQRCTTLTLYFAALSYSVRYPSSVVGVRSPNFALDFSGILSVNGKRCWLGVASMSGQMGKRKED